MLIFSSALTGFVAFCALSSHAVGPVVLLGASQHAVPPVRFLLDVLEEVRRSEDAEQSRGPRGEDLPHSCKQCKFKTLRNKLEASGPHLARQNFTCGPQDSRGRHKRKQIKAVFIGFLLSYRKSIEIVMILTNSADPCIFSS